MTVGEKIQTLRLRAGLSQSQLAKQLCVSRAAVAKWENDNGLPDVSNLKALASFLNIDLNELLDEAKSIPVDAAVEDKSVSVKAPEAGQVPDTFCGKSCSGCQYREALKCPGCREGEGRRYGACRLAQCCRDYNFASCSACSQRAMCVKYRNVPGQQDAKMKERAAVRTKINKHAPVLGKWLWVLFWIIVILTVADVLKQDFIKNWMPWLALTGEILIIAGSMVYGWILLRFSSVSEYYRTAGVCQIAACLLTAVKQIIPDHTGIVLLISLVTIPVGLVAKYNEYVGHAYSLEGIEDDLSSNWGKLWKWRIGLYVTMFISIIFSVFGVFLLIVVLLGILALGGYQMVLLYRTAELFKNFHRKK